MRRLTVLLMAAGMLLVAPSAEACLQGGSRTGNELVTVPNVLTGTSSFYVHADGDGAYAGLGSDSDYSSYVFQVRAHRQGDSVVVYVETDLAEPIGQRHVGTDHVCPPPA